MFAWGPLEVPVADDPPGEIFIKAHFLKQRKEWLKIIYRFKKFK